jgi:hypothetical protein
MYNFTLFVPFFVTFFFVPSIINPLSLYAHFPLSALANSSSPLLFLVLTLSLLFFLFLLDLQLFLVSESRTK